MGVRSALSLLSAFLGWNNLAGNPSHTGSAGTLGPTVADFSHYVSADSLSTLESSLSNTLAITPDGSLLALSAQGLVSLDPTTLLLTGLTRDGVYLIEDGRISAAVNNFRFNESPLDLLRRATEAGAAEQTLPREWADWATRAVMPTLRIPDFHMSSVSQAQ